MSRSSGGGIRVAFLDLRDSETNLYCSQKCIPLVAGEALTEEDYAKVGVHRRWAVCATCGKKLV